MLSGNLGSHIRVDDGLELVAVGDGVLPDGGAERVVHAPPPPVLVIITSHTGIWYNPGDDGKVAGRLISNPSYKNPNPITLA